MIRSIVIVLAAALATTSAAPAQTAMQFPLLPQHGSKISGKATITHVSEKPLVADVVVVLNGMFIPENRYPAGIYTGTCARMSAEPVYELKPVVGGRSKSRITEGNPPPGPYVLAVLDTAEKQTLWCGAFPSYKHGKT
jgi:hypothetical protein